MSKLKKNQIVIPLLPLRDIVVFPGMITPLFVGRSKSISALEEVMTKDKTRDEIFKEVEADVEKFKGQYLNHLDNWYSNKDEQSDNNELSEELFSERFREDLSLCFQMAKRLPKDD